MRRRGNSQMGSILQTSRLLLSPQTGQSDVARRRRLAGVVGNQRQAITAMHAALGISQSFGLKLQAAWTLAIAGDSRKALDLASEVAKSRPEDAFVQALGAPLAQAAVALYSGDGSKAIEILKVAAPYDKASTIVLYIRGLAYWKARRGNEAVQEFQKLLALRNLVPSDPLMSMAQLGLARAYALQGDTRKSRVSYQDFFALWKEADPETPILKEAKAEYAKLQ